MREVGSATAVLPIAHVDELVRQGRLRAEPRVGDQPLLLPVRLADGREGFSWYYVPSIPARANLPRINAALARDFWQAGLHGGFWA